MAVPSARRTKAGLCSRPFDFFQVVRQGQNKSIDAAGKERSVARRGSADLQTNEIAVGVQTFLPSDRAQREIGGSAVAADGDAFAFEIAQGFDISFDGEKVIGTAEQDSHRFDRQAGAGGFYR